MLQIKHLSKTYSPKKGVMVKAVDDVSLDFGTHGLVFLLGKSGSGKSTLLNLIGGLDAPDAGEIVVKGRSSQTFTQSDFDSYRNTYVGFVFQEYDLIETKTVYDNIALAVELQGKTADSARIEEVLRQLDLLDDKGNSLSNRKINELSGGQKQRVAIARALIKNPEIILADEPTGALDSETGKQLYEILQELARDKLIIVVTHDKENAEQYGDRVIELKDGKVVADSRKNESAAGGTLPENGSDCVFIKSALPFKRGLAMGAGGLKVKKFRLVSSILLSVVAFTIFGCALLAQAADIYTAELDMIYANGYEIVGIGNTTLSVYEDGDVYYRGSKFTDAQIRDITAFNGGQEPVDLFWDGPGIDSPAYINEHNPIPVGNQGNLYADLSAANTYTVEIAPDTGLEALNLRPDDRLLDKSLSKLPQSFDEIAITDLQADMYMWYGYREADGTVTKIHTPDELIGKKVGRGRFTVSGVFSTEIYRLYLKELLDFDDNRYSPNFDYGNGIRNGAQQSIISCAILKKGFHDWERQQTGEWVPEPGGVFIKLSGNLQKGRAFIETLNGMENGQTYKVYLRSLYSGLATSASGFFEPIVIGGLIATAIFSIFAALLMMNFLNVSIDSRKKEIGILRALGARKKDVTLICLIESLIIALIDFVLSLAIMITLSIVFNNLLYVTMFYVGFLQVFLLALVCFGVAALATILPVLKITGKKPIDIIRNG